MDQRAQWTEPASLKVEQHENRSFDMEIVN